MKIFKRGQKGLTLLELMVVMAILGVLASIVFPAVSGTAEVSADTQVRTDATLVQAAVNDYYMRRKGVNVFTTTTAQILDAPGVAQKASSKWPEQVIAGPAVTSVTAEDISSQANGGTRTFRVAHKPIADVDKEGSVTDDVTVTVNGVVVEIKKIVPEGGIIILASTPPAGAIVLVDYFYGGARHRSEFPPTKATVKGVTIRDRKGKGVNPHDLARDYNSINFSLLISGDYLNKLPRGAGARTTIEQRSYQTYLWLLKKATSAGGSGPDDAREVAVFKLVSVTVEESSGQESLTYEQIY